MNMQIQPGHVALGQLQAIHSGVQHLSIPASSRAIIRASQQVVQSAADGDAPVYGVNTGFGKLANQRIGKAQFDTLQLNLIRSHSVGVGEPLAAEVVRLMLALKAASLARGHSGVREIVIDTLLAVHNAGLVPYVPSQGSVSASGDLAPLEHMTLVLMPFGLLLKLLEQRVGYYGPKFGALLFGEPNRFVLFLQHLVIGWVSALPLLLILVRLHGRPAPMAIGAAYGLAYYVVVNSFALPLFFGEPTPWQLGFSFIHPSVVIHLVFGICIAATSRKFVTSEGARRANASPSSLP